ncbi:hypothetical protein L6259_00040 [Candidatus Parcubacteria bacterium]|nr:hypothetical protein [Candidatus Parcubacteria bacterium]
MKKAGFLILLSLLLILPIGIKADSPSLAFGALIKGSGPAIYYYASDSGRYAFPNEATFKTWYNNFSGVITISDIELAAVPFKGNINCKPGVKMLKIQTDPKVYAVGEDGKLRWVETEALAKELYGSDWNKKIIDIPIAFFTNYEIGVSIETKNSYSPVTIMSQFNFVNTNKNVKKIMSS